MQRVLYRAPIQADTLLLAERQCQHIKENVMQMIEQGMCSKAQDLVRSMECDLPFCHRGWTTPLPIIQEADAQRGRSPEPCG
jgi:hypothetical protein